MFHCDRFKGGIVASRLYWGLDSCNWKWHRYTNSRHFRTIVQIASSALKLAAFLGRNTSDADKLSLELEHRVGRNGSHAPSTVSPLRLNDQCSLLAGAHVQETLVPSLDDLALTDVEAERLATVVAGIELGAVGVEGTAVVDVDLVAWRFCQYTFEGVVACGAYRSWSSLSTRPPCQPGCRGASRAQRRR
jgi:hypothetical protein